MYLKKNPVKKLNRAKKDEFIVRFCIKETHLDVMFYATATKTTKKK